MSGPATEAVGDRRHPRRLAALVGALVVVVGLGAYLIAGHVHTSATAAGASGSGHSSPATSMAPNGTFTTLAGAPATIASLRGKPTMVWLVAGGCASCAASIPAVAQHLAQLRADGVQVVTLGLWGAFPAGEQGLAQLASFGRAAVGGSIARPGWSWGMASKALSVAYDPSGTPDLYALIGPDGHVRYQGSVPVSTMPQLLAAARRLRVVVARTTSAVISCC